jgi:flagella basal body P-ring formation protein FlgA
MKMTLLLLIFSTTTVFGACEVNLPTNLIVLGIDRGSTSFQMNDCTEMVGSDLHQILTQVEGKISSLQIEEMLLQKGHKNVNIKPRHIRVKQLRSMIREQLTLPPGVQVKSTDGIASPNLTTLNFGDRIELECNPCFYGNGQSIKIIIKSFNGTNRTIMASADFQKMVRAYRLISSVNSFSEIKPHEDLKEVWVEAIPHTDLVTDISIIKFYKSNKSIKSGSLLRHSDLNAINLVRAGLMTEVILENSIIRIKTEGISRGNGALGELVEVFHQQKNKKYLGKVIDLNKVMVEL